MYSSLKPLTTHHNTESSPQSSRPALTLLQGGDAESRRRVRAHRICRDVLAVLLGATLAAAFFGLVALVTPGDGLRVLAAWSGTGALLYPALALLAGSAWRVLLHLAVAGLIFALALASLSGPVAYLVVALGLHGLWAGLHWPGRGAGRSWPRIEPFWMGLNMGLAGMILASVTIA